MQKKHRSIGFLSSLLLIVLAFCACRFVARHAIPTGLDVIQTMPPLDRLTVCIALAALLQAVRSRGSLLK